MKFFRCVAFLLESYWSVDNMWKGVHNPLRYLNDLLLQYLSTFSFYVVWFGWMTVSVFFLFLENVKICFVCNIEELNLACGD